MRRGHPSRQRRPTRDNQGSLRCQGLEGAREEYKTHARPRLYASTLPLEELKVVLAEIATSVEEKLWHWLMCGERTSTLQHEEEYFVELPPKDYQPGGGRVFGLLRYSLYGTRDSAQNWKEELASTLSMLKSTRRGACPCMWQGRIKGEDIVATVHGDDITIGGERSAVEFLIKMISRKYEIKKQVIGEDPDLEKSGRKLNRVIEWNRDGITIEADQRHVREILKGLELERANHSATPCAVERMEARGRINVDRDRPRPSTSGTT